MPEKVGSISFKNTKNQSISSVKCVYVTNCLLFGSKKTKKKVQKFTET